MPTKHLTEAVITKLENPATTTHYSDQGKGAVERFSLRVTPGGKKTFVYRYYNSKGVERLCTIGRWPAWPVTVAREEAKKLQGKIAQGEDPQGVKQAYREGITLGELVNEYNDRHLKGAPSGKERFRLLTRDVVPALGAKTKAVDVERQDIVRLFGRKSKDEKHPVLANRILGVIKSMYNWAQEADKEFIDYRHANPTRGIKKSPEGGRRRYLSSSEITDFWHGLPSGWKVGEPVVDALRLMLATGKRSGEVCGMRWSDIRKDEEDHTWWTIPASETKNNEEDKVTLNSLALEIIEGRKNDYEFVFPAKHIRTHQTKHLNQQSLTKAVKRNIENGHFGEWAKEDPFTPHDLRRTVISHLQMLKVPEPVAKRVLHHVSGSTEGATAVYTRYEYDDEARQAMARWSNKLREIITGETQKVVSIG